MIVYVVDGSPVYHTFRDCHYLARVSAGRVRELERADAALSRWCPHCCESVRRGRPLPT